MKSRVFQLLKLLMFNLLLVFFTQNLHAKKRSPLLLGGDISMLPKHEELGILYRSREGGKPADLIALMQTRGCNTFRVRLFVDPPKEKGMIQDLDYVIDLAKRVKAANAQLLLDIHYSDEWADPSAQTMPAAWAESSGNKLERLVRDYSSDVIQKMKDADCLPDIVQIGNEISHGFLWPDGKMHEQGDWETFIGLIKSAIRGVKAPLSSGEKIEIMIHHNKSGNPVAVNAFFKSLEDFRVDYDLIGLSYYPWWNGGINNLKQSLDLLAERFGKEIIIVETAHPWRADAENTGQDWEVSPAGQKAFLTEVIAAIESTPRGLGRGVIWWYPESVRTREMTAWRNGARALFDGDGVALPALEAFEEYRKPEAKE